MLGKPIDHGCTPDGVDLVLWNHDTDSGYTVMVYPVAKWSCKGEFSPKRGEKFCLCLDTEEKGRKVFDDLKLGKRPIESCWAFYHYPDKDGFAMGLTQSETWTEEDWNRWKAEREEEWS